MSERLLLILVALCMAASGQGESQLFRKVQITYSAIDPQTGVSKFKRAVGDLIVDENRHSGVVVYTPEGTKTNLMIATELSPETSAILRSLKSGKDQNWVVSQHGVGPRVAGTFSHLKVQTTPTHQGEIVVQLSAEFASHQLFEDPQDPGHFQDREVSKSIRLPFSGGNPEFVPVPWSQIAAPQFADRMLLEIGTDRLVLPSVYVVQRIGETTDGNYLMVMSDQLDDQQLAPGIKLGVFEVAPKYLGAPTDSMQVERALGNLRAEAKLPPPTFTVQDKAGKTIKTLQESSRVNSRHGKALLRLRRAELEVPDGVEAPAFLVEQGQKIALHLQSPPRDQPFSTNDREADRCAENDFRKLSPSPN